MAFQPHYKVTALGVTGTLASPIEIWSWGFQFGQPSDGGDSTVGDVDLPTMAAIETFIELVHTQSDIPTGSNHFLTGFKVAQIGPDGLYAAPVQEVMYNPPVAGEGTGAAPLQLCLAVSLRGPLALPRVQGRFFLPVSSSVTVVSSTGKINGTGPSTLSSRLSDYIDTLNVALDTWTPGYRMVVASSKGTNAPVTAIRVGDVLDTQRKRRNGLVETYVENAVTP